MVFATPRRAGVLGVLASLFVVALVLGPPGAPANARQDVVKYPDIIYTWTTSGPLTMDIYRPKFGVAYPNVLAIHGGSWRRGDKSDWADVAYRMAAGGFVVYVANYRLAPPNGDTTFPGPVDDLKVAYQFINDNALTYHGDHNDIGIIGSSAGGHLGLLLGEELGGTDMAPGAIVGLSAPTDLTRMAQDGPLSQAVRRFVGCNPETCPETYTQASPVDQVTPTHPEVLLTYSSDEIIPVSDGRALSDRLWDLNIQNRLVVTPGSGHALKTADEMIPKAMRYLRNKLS